MSVLALSLGLSTVLILTALHIASYTHIPARRHTHIPTTVSVDPVSKGRVVISATNNN